MHCTEPLNDGINYREYLSLVLCVCVCVCVCVGRGGGVGGWVGSGGGMGGGGRASLVSYTDKELNEKVCLVLYLQKFPT